MALSYGTAVRSEDKCHGVYCPGVQPDLTHFRGDKDGTHHAIYELKVVTPHSAEDATTHICHMRQGGEDGLDTPCLQHHACVRISDNKTIHRCHSCHIEEGGMDTLNMPHYGCRGGTQKTRPRIYMCI